MEEEMKFKIETTNRREAAMYLQAPKMALALNELMELRRALYNDREYDTMYLYDGKLYTQNEMFHLERDYEKDKEEGKTCITVMTADQVMHKIDNILRGLEDIIIDWYE